MQPERTQFEVPIRNQFGQAGVGRLFIETYIKPFGHPDARAIHRKPVGLARTESLQLQVMLRIADTQHWLIVGVMPMKI